MEQDDTKLLEAATDVRTRAYAPYSDFKVGAAVETENGDIYTGCNVESASYGLTVCAERVAVWEGISRGVTKFGRVAVVVDTEELAPPCGVCGQIIWEFCGDVPVILSNLDGDKDIEMGSAVLARAGDSKFWYVKA